jgi:hypothetical protein
MINGNQAKKELKAAGIDTKKIRIYTRRGSGSLNVSIRDLSISVESVDAVLRKYENISRCEHTGEILQGGNDFVFIGYDWEASIPEAFVDAFQLACAYWGRLPRNDQSDRYHFSRAIMKDGGLTESQAYATFNHCLAAI